jgi:imidazole glycerol-phosphate synthase subunit HisH
MIGLLKMPIANLKSAWNALYENGIDPILVDELSDFDELTHLIVPGVGNFRAVMENLNQRGLPAKIRAFADSKRPLLGICVGMQLLATWGTESEMTQGLNLVPGKVVKLVENGELRLPHVGWNTVSLRRNHPVFEGVKPNRDFYFVHSYGFVPDNDDDWLGETTYGRPFASVVARNNVVGFQFHPEKSQTNGIKLLENFCHWDGRC